MTDLMQNSVQAARVRDRVLLYVRGLDIDPEVSLEVALETVRRSGGGDIRRAMESLREILAERELLPPAFDKFPADEDRLKCVPEMNRCSMIAEEMDTRLWRRLFRLLMPSRRARRAAAGRRV